MPAALARVVPPVRRCRHLIHGALQEVPVASRRRERTDRVPAPGRPHGTATVDVAWRSVDGSPSSCLRTGASRWRLSSAIFTALDARTSSTGVPIPWARRCTATSRRESSSSSAAMTSTSTACRRCGTVESRRFTSRSKVPRRAPVVVSRIMNHGRASVNSGSCAPDQWWCAGSPTQQVCGEWSPGWPPARSRRSGHDVADTARHAAIGSSRSLALLRTHVAHQERPASSGPRAPDRVLPREPAGQPGR